MTRSGTARRLTAAVLALGLFGTLAVAQPPRPGAQPPAGPLAEAKARQQIADQKAEKEVAEAIQMADQLAKRNAAKAIQTLKAAQTNIDLAVSISSTARTNLTDQLQRKIAAIEGKPLPVAAGPKDDPKAAAVRKDRAAAFESYKAEIKDVQEGVGRYAKYKQAGLNREADYELAKLAKAYPNNPSVIVLQEKGTFANRVEDSAAFAKLQSDRIIAANNSVMVSSLPIGGNGDIEFPKDWKDKTERRLKTVELSAKEKKIIEALNKPTSVNWNNTMLEEALQELSTAMDQNLFLDKKSLSDLGIDLQKPVSLQAKNVSTRTVLRQLLAAQGLTFVVKDESIQVVTVEKAKEMLVTRVYYLGDLVQGVGPFGGAPQWGPFLDHQQTMANVETIVKTIQKSIDPLSWRENGGPSTITFHFPSMSIIVRASTEVHATLGASMRR